jgi:uncharacterized Zn finger protein
MCKHVAAVLYGIGARLDERPELLFKLRKVNEKDLIAKAGSGLLLSKKGPAKERVLAADGLSELFGLEMGAGEDGSVPVRTPTPAKPAKTAKTRAFRSSPSAKSKTKKQSAAKLRAGRPSPGSSRGRRSLT